MNAKSPSRPKHLFVVKDSATSRFKMVSVENLTNEQRQYANSLIAKSRSPGVLVAAYTDESVYNCRPLLLIDGSLHLLRCSSVQLALQTEQFSVLQNLISAIQRNKLTNNLKYFGAHEGQIFCLRRYFQHTLADEGLEWLPFHPLQFSQLLAKQIHALHSANLFHGHICLSNISFNENGPLILDHGWVYNYTEGQPLPADLAPEQNLGNVASMAADIYGLGAVLKTLLTDENNPKVLQILDRMRLVDASARPNIAQVLEVLCPHENHRAAAAQIVTKVSSNANAIASGKLINKSKLQNEAVASKPRTLDQKTYSPSFDKNVGKSNFETDFDPIQATQYISQPIKAKNIISNNAAAPAKISSASPSSLKIGDATITIIAAAIFTVLAFLYKYGAFENRTSEIVTINTQIPLANYWSSNQPSLMQQVAQAAIDGSTEAQMVIISDSLKGNLKPLVRNELLRTAFNPLWEKQLSSEDRLIALQLALNKLLSSSKINLAPLHDAHPAVILAIAGNLPDLNLVHGSSEFAAIPLEAFIQLPKPYSTMFQQLKQLGINSLEHVNARALAHILTGDLSQESVLALVAESPSKSATLAKIAILLPLIEHAPKSADIVFAALNSSSNQILDLIQWFGLEDLADWSKISKLNLLKIIVGIESIDNLTASQLADLLKFPDKIVRVNAIKQLSKLAFAKSSADTIIFLGSNQNQLNRFQTISLIAALQSEGEFGYSLLAKMLDTSPDPRSILGVLLSRASISKADPYSLDLARYLARVKWEANLTELQALSSHPERYARVLAYSRMDPSNPQHLKILQNAAIIEPHEVLRKQLLEKLNPDTEKDLAQQ